MKYRGLKRLCKLNQTESRLTADVKCEGTRCSLKPEQLYNLGLSSWPKDNGWKFALVAWVASPQVPSSVLGGRLKKKKKKKAVQNTYVLGLAYVNTYSYSEWSRWDLKAIQSQKLLKSFSYSTFEMAIQLLSPEIQLCPLHPFKKYSWSRLLCIIRSDHISNLNSKFLRRLLEEFRSQFLVYFSSFKSVLTQ